MLVIDVIEIGRIETLFRGEPGVGSVMKLEYFPERNEDAELFDLFLPILNVCVCLGAEFAVILRESRFRDVTGLRERIKQQTGLRVWKYIGVVESH